MRTVKHEQLCTLLCEMGSVIVAYSGGVDSALLAMVAHDVLGETALAVTARSPSLPARELKEAAEVASLCGFRHMVIETSEVSDPRYAANPINRCYYCKAALFDELEALRVEIGFNWLAYGENLSDQGDHRPGAAAAGERGVRAPLREAGFSKEEIRTLARHLGLPVWNKPAFACLASRIPYGHQVTPERLAQLEAAEDHLWALGFRQFRVRHHGAVARIEVEPDDRSRLVACAEAVSERLKALGFTYVAMDLLGYRRGSMNEAGPVFVAADLEVI